MTNRIDQAVIIKKTIEAFFDKMHENGDAVSVFSHEIFVDAYFDHILLTVAIVEALNAKTKTV